MLTAHEQKLIEAAVYALEQCYSYTGGPMIRVMKQVALIILQKAIDDVPKDKESQSPDVHHWHETTRTGLGTIYGDNSDVVKRFDSIRFNAPSKHRIRVSYLQQDREAASRELQTKRQQAKRQTFQTACARTEALLRGLIERVRTEPEKFMTPIRTDNGLSFAPTLGRGDGTTINVTGDYIANTQVNSPHATQHVAITINQQVLETVNKIKAAAEESDELDDHDKDEIRHGLDRVCQLAKREPNEKTIKSINEKLTTVEKIIGIAEKLAKIAGPLILVARAHLGV